MSGSNVGAIGFPPDCVTRNKRQQATPDGAWIAGAGLVWNHPACCQRPRQCAQNDGRLLQGAHATREFKADFGQMGAVMKWKLLYLTLKRWD